MMKLLIKYVHSDIEHLTEIGGPAGEMNTKGRSSNWIEQPAEAEAATGVGVQKKWAGES